MKRLLYLFVVLFVSAAHAQEYCHSIEPAPEYGYFSTAEHTSSGTFSRPEWPYIYSVSVSYFDGTQYDDCSDFRPWDYCYEQAGYTFKTVDLTSSSKPCPNGYSLFQDNDGVYKCESVYLCGDDSQICADGLPASAGIELGYGSTCDRPALKQCDSGDYVTASSPCPGQCVDEQSCYAYAYNTTGCSQTDNILFEYNSPTDWAIQCTDTDGDGSGGSTGGGSGGGGTSNGQSIDYTGYLSDINAGISSLNSSLTNSLNTLNSTNSSGFNSLVSSIDSLQAPLNDISTNTQSTASAIDNQTLSLNESLLNVDTSVQSGSTSINNALTAINNSINANSPIAPIDYTSQLSTINNSVGSTASNINAQLQANNANTTQGLNDVKNSIDALSTLNDDTQLTDAVDSQTNELSEKLSEIRDAVDSLDFGGSGDVDGSTTDVTGVEERLDSLLSQNDVDKEESQSFGTMAWEYITSAVGFQESEDDRIISEFTDSMSKTESELGGVEVQESDLNFVDTIFGSLPASSCQNPVFNGHQLDLCKRAPEINAWLSYIVMALTILALFNEANLVLRTK